MAAAIQKTAEAILVIPMKMLSSKKGGEKESQE